MVRLGSVGGFSRPGRISCAAARTTIKTTPTCLSRLPIPSPSMTKIRQTCRTVVRFGRTNPAIGGRSRVPCIPRAGYWRPGCWECGGLMRGLSRAEASERLTRFGPNALPEQQPEPLWRRFVRQFNNPLIFILLFALAFDVGLWVVEGAHGWPIEASAIALILLFNAALGLYQEQRSEAALARLKVLAGAHAWVLR